MFRHCTTIDYSTFLKMQQLRECQFSKTVAFVRGTRIRQYMTFAARQTHRLTRQPYLVVEVIPSLFYVCSLLEYIGRLCKIERSKLVNQLGKNNIKRLYKDADTLHCEPIEKIADEVISIYNITSGDFDNVLRCHYAVPDYWTIGAVYERLIEDICAENESIDFIVDTLVSVYSSWIDGAISNYNTDFFYQSREYIFESWKEGTPVE